MEVSHRENTPQSEHGSQCCEALGGFQPSLGGGCSGVRKCRAECCLLILLPAVLRALSILSVSSPSPPSPAGFGVGCLIFQVGKLRQGAVQQFILQEQNLSSPPSTAGQELEEIPLLFLGRKASRR